MGLLEQEIKELRQMNKMVMEGKISPEQVSSRIAIYSQTEKRAKMILQAHAMRAKHGKRILDGISRTNLIGDGASIDMQDDIEVEMIKCPDLDKVITRHDCLDYSGSSEHYESCKSCKNFSTTRRVLLENGNNSQG